MSIQGRADRIAWVHGLRGLASWVIILSHVRLCFWEWSIDASTDGHTYLIQWPFVRLICAGRPAVRVLFVLSGLVLSTNTARHIHAGRSNAALVCVLRGIHTRYWRLMLPVLCASALSVGLMSLGAYNLSITAAPGYLSYGPPRTEGNLAKDFWKATWGSVVDVWISGWQPAHSSLWCMKAILFGSYLLYRCWLTQGCRPTPPLCHWVVSACLLLSSEAALTGLIDCSGTVLGGVVAYHLAAGTKFHSSVAIMGLFVGLFLASFPIGKANATWCSWLFDLASHLMQLHEYHNHINATSAFWHNIAAFILVMSVSQLEQLQSLLSTKWLQASGTISFALFLIHPIVFWTVGGMTVVAARAGLVHCALFTYRPAVTMYTEIVAMLATSLPISWFASLYWHKYVENPLWQQVRLQLCDAKDIWTLY